MPGFSISQHVMSASSKYATVYIAEEIWYCSGLGCHQIYTVFKFLIIDLLVVAGRCPDLAADNMSTTHGNSWYKSCQEGFSAAAHR